MYLQPPLSQAEKEVEEQQEQPVAPVLTKMKTNREVAKPSKILIFIIVLPDVKLFIELATQKISKSKSKGERKSSLIEETIIKEKQQQELMEVNIKFRLRLIYNYAYFSI